MKFPRRKFLHLAAGAAVLPAFSRSAGAQSYPARPVRLIVGFPAGGPNDFHARLIGQWLSERLGQQFIVENRPGAGGNNGTEAVVRATADGYTLLLVSVSDVINATLYERTCLQFPSRHSAGRGHGSQPLRYGGQSIRSNEKHSGVHRLCQSQPRQNQHGVGRQREHSPRCR